MSIIPASIREAHEGLTSKQFSAVELAQSYLDRIGKYDEVINAYVTVDKEGALKSAQAVDDKISAGESIGILAGLPVGMKDLLNTRGVRTTNCSPGMRNFVPPYDATAVSMLKEAGMVMLGKTNLDEHACGVSTERSYFGVTKNPWNLDKVAGGSSGGSAAAVAADLCLYSIGTDTGGSIRQPASLCGVPSLKVTYGRVSRFGVTAMASSWDTVGPFAKTIEDLALVTQAIAGHDPLDATTPSVEVPDYASMLKGDVKGLKIGVPKEYFAEGIQPDVEKSVRDALAQYEAMGAELHEISFPMTKYAVAVYYVTQPAELSANLSRFDGLRFGEAPTQDPESLIDYYFKQRGEAFGDEIKRRIMMGTYVLSAGYFDAYYKKAQRVRTKIIQEFNEAFEKVDVVIGPVSPFPAFGVGEMVNDPLAMYMADVYTIPASAAGVPAVSVPCGFSSAGLPISFQVIGPQFEEGKILDVAYAYEQAMDWKSKKPEAYTKS